MIFGECATLSNPYSSSEPIFFGLSIKDLLFENAHLKIIANTATTRKPENDFKNNALFIPPSIESLKVIVLLEGKY